LYLPDRPFLLHLLDDGAHHFDEGVMLLAVDVEAAFVALVDDLDAVRRIDWAPADNSRIVVVVDVVQRCA
jgi:hypothetical protein